MAVHYSEPDDGFTETEDDFMEIEMGLSCTPFLLAIPAWLLILLPFLL